ncbi:MAG: hypothetical protein SPF89_04925 [Sphaerochaetaceae bacterium]|nr:hypothetical protein [Spirochaetales bacterium]MDY5499428.1 hypothetical protein [Sphaerochaetaceae bacterium]
MIAAIGEARCRDGNFCGLALAVATQAVARGSSAAMLGPVSQDEEGRAILEYMVDHWVMFDPDLAQNPLPSSQVALSLTEQGLANALKVNSDIRLAYVGGASLTGSTGDAILAALNAYVPEPVVMLEPADSSEDKDRLLRVLADADMVKLTEKEFSLLCPEASPALLGKQLGVKDIWLRGTRRQLWWNQAGWTVECPVSDNPGQESGTVAASLHDAGCFGLDGEKPDYHVTIDAVRKALEACREA